MSIVFEQRTAVVGSAGSRALTDRSPSRSWTRTRRTSSRPSPSLVDLDDGRVLRTVSHPDRDVIAASGTPAVLVYTIRDRAAGEPSSDEGVLHFVVRDGEAQGVPLLGLPDDPYVQVLAGPPAS